MDRKTEKEAKDQLEHIARKVLGHNGEIEAIRYLNELKQKHKITGEDWKDLHSYYKSK